VNAEKILVVEDSAAIALDLSWQLETLGYDVVGIASSGEDALRQIADTEPDAVLMDIRLSGGMDGIETASRIPDTVNPAVIYLTGSSEEKTLKRARETQPYGYLLKPFSERELHATIQIALERRRAAEMLRMTERRLEAANAALQAEVAARIQSEQEIRKERDTAQRYLDVAGVMILTLSAEGIVTLINNRGCAILGHDKPEAILGRNWLDNFVPERLRTDERDRFDSLREPRDATLEFAEYPVLTKAGDERMIAWRMKILTDADGRFHGTLSSGDDITERKSAEARMHEMQDELMHVSRLSAMGQMSSTLAHEINQPLAAIGNYVRAGLTMLDSDNPEIVAKGRGAFEKAALQAERASDVVGNLREFVRKGDAVRKPENLRVVIQDAISLAQLGGLNRGTTVQLNLSDQAEWATVNRVQIQQVLVNLIRNAMEAMTMTGGRGQITVETHLAAPDTIEVSVADTGPGLPPKLNGDLFKPFITTKPQGMGVGLAICQSIVEAHGGKIWAESPRNDGAIFRFTVPGPSETFPSETPLN
jgi:two-component system sensor kinase FixL